MDYRFEILTNIVFLPCVANFFKITSPNDLDSSSMIGGSGPPYKIFFPASAAIVRSYVCTWNRGQSHSIGDIQEEKILIDENKCLFDGANLR